MAWVLSAVCNYTPGHLTRSPGESWDPPISFDDVLKAGTHQSASMMFFVYLLASQPHGTLYVGMTDDLVRRIWEHKTKVVPGFSAKYRVNRLVWFQAHQTREAAWRREKQIKDGSGRGRFS